MVLWWLVKEGRTAGRGLPFVFVGRGNCKNQRRATTGAAESTRSIIYCRVLSKGHYVICNRPHRCNHRDGLHFTPLYRTNKKGKSNFITWQKQQLSETSSGVVLPVCFSRSSSQDSLSILKDPSFDEHPSSSTLAVLYKCCNPFADSWGYNSSVRLIWFELVVSKLPFVIHIHS